VARRAVETAHYTGRRIHRATRAGPSPPRRSRPSPSAAHAVSTATAVTPAGAEQRHDHHQAASRCRRAGPAQPSGNQHDHVFKIGYECGIRVIGTRASIRAGRGHRSLGDPPRHRQHRGRKGERHDRAAPIEPVD
jgi:hypothetical protein